MKVYLPRPMFECHRCFSLESFLHPIRFLCVIDHVLSCNGAIGNKSIVLNWKYSWITWKLTGSGVCQHQSLTHAAKRYEHLHTGLCWWTGGILYHHAVCTIEQAVTASRKLNPLLCLSKNIVIINMTNHSTFLWQFQLLCQIKHLRYVLAFVCNSNWL